MFRTVDPIAVPLSFAPSWLDMPKIDAASFPMFRSEAIAAISRDPGLREWLDYARVMFNGGFFAEALSGLERAAALGLPPEGEMRMQAALLALGLEAAGRGACRCGGLDPRAEAGASYFAVLVDLSQTDTPDPARITALSGALAQQSQAVAGFVGPMLFDAARRAGDVALAGRLLDAVLAAHPPDAAVSARLRGEYAELRGEDAEAFGHYVEALAHHAPDAFLARLRIADMALRNRDAAALQAVRDFLIEGLQEWHGGETGLAMLTRLAAVSEALLDAPAALEAMARIRGSYPQAPQARLAGERAEVILRAHAAALAEGRGDLAGYAALIRRLRGGLADLSAWVPARTALAEAFEREGLVLAAAAEFGAIRDDIRAYRSPVSPAAEADLLRNQVRLLALSGHAAEALTQVTLRSDLVAADAALRLQALAVMDVAALNMHLAAAPQAGFSGPEHLLMARIRFAAGDHVAALRDWRAFLAAGGQMEGVDAANYLYAKYRVENPAQLALDGPVTPADRDFLDGMAAALSDPQAAPGRLDRDTAQRILDEAVNAAEMAEVAKK